MADEAVFQKIVCNLRGKIRRRKYKGKMHVVVPVVMAGKGVLNGSDGPGLYTDEEWEKTVIPWNHKPIVNCHPENGTADDDEVMEKSSLGFVRNTSYRNSKLGAEAWLDEELTNKVNPKIIKNLDAGKNVEVSTGIFCKQIPKNGTYGKTKTKYTWIANEIKPDHLAILTDEPGAFSVKDGGGLLQVNNSAAKPDVVPVLNRSVAKALETLEVKLVANELGFSQKSMMLSELLSSKVGEKGKSWYGWIVEVYSDYVIYHDKGDYYKISYTASGETVNLSGEPEKVQRVVSYSPVKNGSSITKNQENDVMSKKFNKKTYISELVTNGGYEESDREWLEALDDDAVQKIRPVANSTVEEPDAPVANAKKKATAISVQEALDTLPAPIANSLKGLIKRDEKERNELVEKLHTVSNSKLNKKWLEKQDTDNLRGLLELTKNSRASVLDVGDSGDDDDDDGVDMFDYSGASGAAVKNNRKESNTEPGYVAPVLNMAKMRENRIAASRARLGA